MTMLPYTNRNSNKTSIQSSWQPNVARPTSQNSLKTAINLNNGQNNTEETPALYYLWEAQMVY